MRIWAIIEDVGSEYPTICPTVLSDSLESIQRYNGEHGSRFPIVYKDIVNENFECVDYEGDDDTPDWKYWSGTKHCGVTWRNIKTGEFDPDFEDRDDWTPEMAEDWEDGCLFEVYEDGELVKTYFE